MKVLWTNSDLWCATMGSSQTSNETVILSKKHTKTQRRCFLVYQKQRLLSGLENGNCRRDNHKIHRKSWRKTQCSCEYWSPKTSHLWLDIENDDAYSSYIICWLSQFSAADKFSITKKCIIRHPFWTSIFLLYATYVT